MDDILVGGWVSLLATELWLLSSLATKTHHIHECQEKVLHLCGLCDVSPKAVSQSQSY